MSYRKDRLRFVQVGAIALTLAISTTTGLADSQKKHSYNYVSLLQFLPEGYGCFIAGNITESGAVYGTTFAPPAEYCDEPSPENIPHVAVYKDHQITVLHPGGYASTGNEAGLIGGNVIDPVTGAAKAALFSKKRVEILPPLSPAQISSSVIGVSDQGLALVYAWNSYKWPYSPSTFSYAVHYKGRLTPIYFSSLLDFRDAVVAPWTLSMNSRGVITGSRAVRDAKNQPIVPDRAFRYDLSTGALTFLDPVPPDTFSNSRDINRQGEVLGYAFAAFGVPARIGVWNKKGDFRTYLDETDFGFFSNGLHFNDGNLILISQTDNGMTYLMPKPGKLVDLADLVDFPTGLAYKGFDDLNNRGDILGGGYLFDGAGNFAGYETFVLEPVGAKR